MQRKHFTSCWKCLTASHTRILISTDLEVRRIQREEWRALAIEPTKFRCSETEGETHAIFLPPHFRSLPPDGLLYLENEVRVPIALGPHQVIAPSSVTALSRLLISWCFQPRRWKF
jgi:hypothetical protein